jgi:hypothetical protein
MSEWDKLFLRVLEELPPHLLDVLIHLQERTGLAMAQFITEAIREKLDRLSPEQRGQVLEALRKEGIDLEAPQ